MEPLKIILWLIFLMPTSNDVLGFNREYSKYNFAYLIKMHISIIHVKELSHVDGCKSGILNLQPAGRMQPKH